MRLQLAELKNWLGHDLIEKIENKRKTRGEYSRERKLDTAGTLLFCLGVALHSEKRGLREILKLVAAEFDFKWSVSAAAFCKARMRFSP